MFDFPTNSFVFPRYIFGLLGPKAPDILVSTVYITPSEKVRTGRYTFSCRLDLQPFLDLVGVKTKAFRYLNFTRDSPMACAVAQCLNYNVDLTPHAQGKNDSISRVYFIA